MKQYNFSKGRKGESIAQKYLEENGFCVIDKNWRTRFGELDLIATKDNVLHFVEVKLKVGDYFGTPEEMIDKRKIWQVQKTAEAYLLKNKKTATQFLITQIDAVCIVVDSKDQVESIKFYKNLTII